MTTTLSTCDICDQHDDVQVLSPTILSEFGGASSFSGPIHTLKVFEDNALIRECVATEGNGRVLVVDGGGSVRASLLGGNLAKAAAKNGWAGLVIYGCVRDVQELRELPIGIRAIALFPRKTERGLHTGRAGDEINFGGVVFVEGAYLYADHDGIVVARDDLSLHA